MIAAEIAPLFDDYLSARRLALDAIVIGGAALALCDRGTDLADCIALKPTVQELEDALAWIQYQDANPDWPRHVVSVLQDLGGRLGHGI